MIARSLSEQVPAEAQRIAPATTVLWPEHDPLFPRDWGDRLEQFFAQVTTRDVPDAGHFVPLERPDAFAAAIGDVLS